MTFVTIELTADFDSKEDHEEGGQNGGVIGGAIDGVISSAIDDSPQLTKRQKEVLKLIAKSKAITYNEIAEVLGINEATIGNKFNIIKTYLKLDSLK